MQLVAFSASFIIHDPFNCTLSLCFRARETLSIQITTGERAKTWVIWCLNM